MSNFRKTIITTFSIVTFITACGHSTESVNTRTVAGTSVEQDNESIYARNPSVPTKRVEFDFGSKGTNAGCLNWIIKVQTTKAIAKVELKRAEKGQKDDLAVVTGAQEVNLTLKTRGAKDLLSFESPLGNAITMTGTAKRCDNSGSPVTVSEDVSSDAEAKNVSLLDENGLGANINWSARLR